MCDFRPIQNGLCSSKRRGEIATRSQADILNCCFGGSILGVESPKSDPTGVRPRCYFSQLFKKYARFISIDFLKKSEISDT
jgi:hypothetical protein